MADMRLAREFLALPVEALPSARFAEPDDAWQHDAWAVLRDHVRTGESCTSLCGTQIVVRAVRDGWRINVVID